MYCFFFFFCPFPVFLHTRQSEVAGEDEIKGWIPLAIKVSFDSTGSLHISKIDHEVHTLHANGLFKIKVRVNIHYLLSFNLQLQNTGT